MTYKTRKELKLDSIVSTHGLEKDEWALANWTPTFMDGKLSNRPHVLEASKWPIWKYVTAFLLSFDQ